MADVATANAFVPNSPPDRELIEAARAGDVAAFSLLVDRHYASLLRCLQRQLGDPELAADLAQETWADAFRRLDHLDRDSSFAAWLYGVSRNHVRMEYRRRRIRRFVSLDWLLEPLMPIAPALQRADDTASCDARDAMQTALDALTPAFREALLLHSLEGYTAPEVARMVGISTTAAERRISRAKLQFRDRYRAVNGEDPS